jgi:serum/glucocorticoid-regulated kinase 2
MQRLFDQKRKVNNSNFTPTASAQKLLKRVPSGLTHSRQLSGVLTLARPETSSVSRTISRISFNFHYAIGRGGFGKVWKVELKRSRTLFALKEMQKLRVISKRSVHSVMNERKILESLNHNFLVNMHFAFQDRENLFLVLDLKTGGDLRYQMAKNKRFSEAQAKFFICCLLTGLSYIHANRVIHRDIKPENLVFDEKGYLFITDFGIARTWAAENSKDTSGTPGYMAPEVMFRQNHGFAVDYFAVGIILFELIVGRRPYVGRDRKEIRDQILSKQAKISEVPEGWSFEAVDFANKLVQRKVTSRLGNSGISEIMTHPWVRYFSWKELQEGTLVSPFVPKAQDNFDPRNLGEWKDEIDPTIDLPASQNLFIGYSFEGRVEGSARHKKSLSLI